MVNRYVLGLDLGPAAAFTALAVVERADDDRLADADPTYAVKHLHRFPPGTAYGAIATAVGDLLATEQLADSPVVVDITAVGSNVLELFRDLINQWHEGVIAQISRVEVRFQQPETEPPPMQYQHIDPATGENEYSFAPLSASLSCQL